MGAVFGSRLFRGCQRVEIIKIRATVLALDCLGFDVLGAERALLFNRACPGRMRIAKAGPDQQ